MRKLSLAAVIMLLCSVILTGCGEEEVPPNKRNVGCVYLFDEPNLKGNSKKICGSTKYVGDDFDNKTSSFYVDCEAENITIYTERNFEGEELEISANYEGREKGGDLKKKRCGETFEMGPDWDNKVSSIKVDPL